jgi:hypothetical protein
VIVVEVAPAPLPRDASESVLHLRDRTKTDRKEVVGSKVKLGTTYRAATDHLGTFTFHCLPAAVFELRVAGTKPQIVDLSKDSYRARVNITNGRRLLDLERVRLSDLMEAFALSRNKAREIGRTLRTVTGTKELLDLTGLGAREAEAFQRRWIVRLVGEKESFSRDDVASEGA